METTTETLLVEIQTVKSLLIFLVFILSLIAWLLISAQFRTSRFTRRVLLSQHASDQARDLLCADKPDEAIEICKARLATHPKDRDVLWLLGRAYQDKEEYSKALEIFNTLLEIEPAWAEEHIEPHIRVIKEVLEKTDLKIL
jgi:cytochrome c-type biogenesis protein CcmH/NrfG